LSIIAVRDRLLGSEEMSRPGAGHRSPQVRLKSVSRYHAASVSVSTGSIVLALASSAMMSVRRYGKERVQGARARPTA
jgi:hypothetical protein